MCVYFKLQAHLGGEEKAERRPTNAILVLSSQSCERFFFSFLLVKLLCQEFSLTISASQAMDHSSNVAVHFLWMGIVDGNRGIPRHC